jgi:16S rRNA (uracil1498-N3)-methyltransferase
LKKRLENVRRYWAPPECFQNNEVRLRGDLLHHVRDVCRQQKGSKFEIIDISGKAHLVEIIAETKQESVARILETRVIPGLARPYIHLVLSVPRFPVFEAVLEKSVELGVKSIKPIFSDFSFTRAKEDVFQNKLKRFEKIVVSATQQSGRGDLMMIDKPLTIDEALRTFGGEALRSDGGRAAGLFAFEGNGVLSAHEGLGKVRERQPTDVWVFAGSEGGFSVREVELFKSFDLQAVTLGSQVLRVETACVALVSIIKYDLDLMR